MDPNIYPVLFQYINESEENTEDTFIKLNSLQCSEQEIASFIWAFLDISKGIKILNENANYRLQTLIIYMTEKSDVYRKLFFLLLDTADTNQFPEIKEMRKSYAIESKKKYNIEKYQLFHTNPEGFARLILFFFLHRSDPDDLIIIIGEHKIDPDVILNIIFELISIDGTHRFIPFLSPFYLEQIIPFVFNGIYTKGDDFYYSILSFLLQNDRIQYNNLWKIVGEPAVILSEIYLNYINAIETHYHDLVVVRTKLPGSTKEESYPSIYFEHQKEYKEHEELLCNSFFFRLLSNSRPFDFKLFGQVSEYDPCLFKPISEVLSNTLYTEFLKDPVLFLQTDQYLNYLCTLSCHCTQNKLIVGICRYPDLIPPFIFSNFILQSISTNDCAWQLSIHAYDCIMHYPIPLRRQIYKNFSKNQRLIGYQKLQIATVTRRMTKYLFKRLSTENIDQYTMKISQLFLMSPSIASDKLLEYLFTIANISSIPFLIIADLSPLSLDYLLLEICEKIKIPDLFSDHLVEIATFLGKTFSQHYMSMDLKGYISFIKKGLKELKFPYLCLLKSLITEMTSINYKGNLSKSDIELRIGDNLLIISNKVEIEDHFEFEFSRKYADLQTLFLKDQTALKILVYIERMLQKSDINDPNKLDEVRFTFITICDFLNHVKITEMTPSELIEELHFSLASATKISHQSYQELQSLSPSEVPPELFGRFWSYNSSDFHLPEQKFEEIDNHFQTRIEESGDPDFITSLKIAKEKLTISMKKQKNRIESIRNEITKKKWFTSRVSFSIYAGFVNHCIVPRMQFSQEDARYCALFIFSLSHFTDFRISIFNRFFTKYLHFYILAATYEEARCIGLFIMKLLKYCRERDEESDLHSFLIEKFEIILKRCQEKNSEFLINKTIIILNLISKDFPKFKDEEEKLDALLEELNSSEKQSISTQINRYLSNRKTKVSKREAKEKSLFSPEPDRSDDDDYSNNYNDEDNYYSDNNNSTDESENESPHKSMQKRKQNDNIHPMFSNLPLSSASSSLSPSSKLQSASIPISSSASTSWLDFDLLNLSNSSNSRSFLSPQIKSGSRIKRSQSRQIHGEDERSDDDYDIGTRSNRALLRRSKSTNSSLFNTTSVDSASLQSNPSIDSYLYGTNSSTLSGTLANYYSMQQASQWNQLVQMQMLSAAAAATATTTDTHQQQQHQITADQAQIDESHQLQLQQQHQQQANSTQFTYSLNPYLSYYYPYK